MHYVATRGGKRILREIFIDDYGYDSDDYLLISIFKLYDLKTVFMYTAFF